MKLKIKVKEYDSGISITNLDMSSEETVDKLLGRLVQENLLFDSYLPRIKTMGYTYGELHALKISNLFHGMDKAVLTSDNVEITITHKKSDTGLKAEQVLLDYSQLVNVIEKFKELESEAKVSYGTVFFIQQEKQQYLVRYEEHGFELYHFKLQYENAFKDEDRYPFMILELKTKKELTESELKWIRTIMFPSKERKNPIIHLEISKLNQGVLDELATLIHRVMVIVGKFKVSNQSLESDDKLPSYVQLNEKNSIGFVEVEQLKRIVEAQV